LCVSLGEESVNMKSLGVCITGRRVIESEEPRCVYHWEKSHSLNMKRLGVSINERRVSEHEEPMCEYH